MKRLLALFAALLAAAPQARGASIGLWSTPSRTVQCGDAVPVQQASGVVLQHTTACGIQNFVLTSVGAYGAVGDGVTDDTAAWQAALNTGLPIYCPPGVYKISATLTVTTTANHGQVIRGGSSGSGSGLGSGRCVLKPTAGLAGAVMKIDGTPFSGYLQGFDIEDIAFDLSNQTDVSTNIAINQVKAYDGFYSNVRVLGDGVNKRAWLFSTGAYTTTLANSQGHILDFEGTTSNNGVTTITVLNFDGGMVIANYTASLSFIGGAFQGAAETKFKFRNSGGPFINTDVEGTGTYLDVDSSVTGLWSRSQLQGFSGTYMSGASAPAQVLMDQQTNFNTYPFNFDFGHININNQGAASNSSFLSGASGANYYLYVGRTGVDLLLGAAAGANDFLNGTAAGDAVVSSWGASTKLWLGAAQNPEAFITSTGFNTYGTGTLNQGIVNVQPAADGNSIVWRNAGGTVLWTTDTAAKNFQLTNGASLLFYSDNFSTQALKWTGSSGQLQVGGGTCPGTPAATITLSTGSCEWAGTGVPSNTYGANGDIYLRGDGLIGSGTHLYHRESGAWVSEATGLGTFLASPPAIGGTAAAAITGTTLNATSAIQIAGHLLFSAAAPTISSGFGTSPSIVANNGPGAFQVNVGTGGTASSGVIGLPAAANGWACNAADVTTASSSVFLTRQTASTTTSATLTNYNTAGVATAWTASDKLNVNCQAF